MLVRPLTTLLNLDLTVLQSHEFIVGVAVAAILVSALVASSLFRNIALALAAGAVVLLSPGRGGRIDGLVLDAGE